MGLTSREFSPSGKRAMVYVEKLRGLGRRAIMDILPPHDHHEVEVVECRSKPTEP